MKRFRDMAAIVSIALVSLAIYFGLWQVYFQQDEWSGFGKVLYANAHGISAIIRISGNHFTPLTALFLHFLYNTFGLDPFGYGVTSIVLHAINGVLVYVLARMMFRKTWVAWVTAIFFVTTYAGSQAVTWYAASMSFLPSALFGLVGLIAYEGYVKTKKAGFIAAAIVGVLAASLFRENAIMLLVYMVIRGFVIAPKSANRFFLWAVIAVGIYGLFRISPMLLGVRTITSGAPLERDIVTQSVQAMFVWMPQLLIPRAMGIALMSTLIGQGRLKIMIDYVVDYAFFLNHIVVTVYSVATGVGVGILLWRFVKKELQEVKVRKEFYVLLLLLPLSILPFVMLPKNLYMESRHFYLSVIGMALLLGFIVQKVWERHGAIVRSFLVLVIVLGMACDVWFIRQEIQTQTALSRVRQTLVASVVATYPRVPSRVMFYGQGDALPLQTGTGYMFMMLLAGKQPYEAFLYENFLWNMGSTGYQEKDGIGFGYVTDRAQLMDIYCREHMTADEVFSYVWQEKSQRFMNATEQVRTTLGCPVISTEL